MTGDDLHINGLLGVNGIYSENSVYFGTDVVLSGCPGGVCPTSSLISSAGFLLDAASSLDINTDSDSNIVFGDGNIQFGDGNHYFGDGSANFGTGMVSVGDDITVTGDTNLSGGLFVTGTSHFAGTLNASGTVNITGKTNLFNTVDLQGKVSNPTHAGSFLDGTNLSSVVPIYIQGDYLYTGSFGSDN